VEKMIYLSRVVDLCPALPVRLLEIVPDDTVCVGSSCGHERLETRIDESRVLLNVRHDTLATSIDITRRHGTDKQGKEANAQ